MRWKYLSLFVLLGVSILISGCEEEAEGVTEGPFIGGVNGLSISFSEGAPLSEFSQNKSVPIQVLVKNNGEYDLAGNMAEVQIFGLSMEEYGLSSDYKKVSGELRGIKKDILEEGGEQVVDMGTLLYTRSISDFWDVTLLSQVCYPYQTQARIRACATSRDIKTVEGEGVCDITEDKLISGSVSSGPIQVTSFSEQLRGSNAVDFRITIANSGTGKVYKSDSVCSELTDFVISSQKERRVTLTILPNDITCSFLEGESNVGVVRLDNTGAKTVVCTMNVEGSSSYEREIEIYLDYKYTETASVDMRILEA